MLNVDTVCESALLRKDLALSPPSLMRLWSVASPSLQLLPQVPQDTTVHPRPAGGALHWTGGAGTEGPPIEHRGPFFPQLSDSRTCCGNSTQTVHEGASAWWRRTETKSPHRAMQTYETVLLQVTERPKQVTGAPQRHLHPQLVIGFQCHWKKGLADVLKVGLST